MKILSIVFVLLVVACGEKTETLHPQMKQLTEAVYASGNVYPVNEYKVSANADGFLVKRYVNPGDTINIGSTLFQIDNELQNERLEAIERIYKQAKENYSDHSPIIQEILGAQKTAYDKMKFDSVNFMRFKNLYESNSTSKAQFDNAQLAYQTSSNEYKLKKQTYFKLKNQLYIELQNAENNYNAAHKELSNTSVLSNINGLVYDVLKEQGEAVRRNDILAIVGDASNVYLKLVVDELDINKIEMNQEVFIKLDIAPNKVYHARVSKIYPRLNREDQSFRVDAVFTDEMPGSYYGVTAEANILIHQKNNVLTLPKSVVLKGDTVIVKRGREELKVKIQKGIETFDDVEVVGGVTKDDEVIVQHK